MTDAPTTSVDEVIAAATQGEWMRDQRRLVDMCLHVDTPEAETDMLFVGMFDPTHVALMEAVVKAAEGLHWESDYDWDENLINLLVGEVEIEDALDALAAYRKERGYR